MAPLNPVKKDAPERRVQAILDQSQELAMILKKRDAITTNQRSQLENLIKTSFPNPTKIISNNTLSSLESCGSEIWNASTNIIRCAGRQEDRCAHDDYSEHQGVLLRVFAFLLLDFVYQSSMKRRKGQDRLIRNLKVGMKACKSCLSAGELDLASSVIQKCGKHAAATSEASPLVQLTANGDRNGERAILDELISQLRLLRMTHAWRTERLDLAEHFFLEFSNSQFLRSANLSEFAAEALHEIGRSLSKNNQNELAQKWLQRALAALDSCEITQVSQDAVELRLAAIVSLVGCLVAQPSVLSLQHAQRLVEELGTSHGLGHRPVVHLLQLKVLLASQQVDEKLLNGAMTRLIRSAGLSEHTFNTIMRAINRVSKISHMVASSTSGDFITSRLLPEAMADGNPNTEVLTWIEKACVTYTSFVTRDAQGTQQVTIDWLHMVFDATAKTLRGGFPSRATHAMQALIYKASGTGDTNMAKKWLAMLRHPVFDTAGPLNKAKIGRKAIASAMANDDLEAAREAYFQMTETAQNESRTRYLAFKLALQSDNYQLAVESLNIVAKQADRDPAFLYGCVLEAQQSRMRQLAVAALLAIMDKLPSNVHHTSLLRCTAKLLMGELENPQPNLDEVMQETLRVFESVSGNTQALFKGNVNQRRAELQWWMKNAYNTALKYCGQIHPEHLVRMLRVCTQLTELYPRDDGPMHNDELERRALLCHYLATAALVVLARSYPEDSRERLQSYLEARKENAQFKTLSSKVAPDNDVDKAKTLHRLLDILIFDLECIINLRQWDQLDQALQSCLQLNGVDRWNTLADVALTIQSKLSIIDVDSTTHSSLMELLQNVINDTWKKERNMVKAGRWLRISFSHDLRDGSGTFALDLLGQATSMAKKGYEGKTDPFPEMELQWLSTTAFNKAVDLLAQVQGQGCGQWLDGALELARYSDDNGALHANLTDKRRQFDERLRSEAQV